MSTDVNIGLLRVCIMCVRGMGGYTHLEIELV